MNCKIHNEFKYFNFFFRVSGDISCPYPFCKRKFQSQNEFTPRALEQHLENPGNWHKGIILTIIIKLLYKRLFVQWSTNGMAWWVNELFKQKRIPEC